MLAKRSFLLFTEFSISSTFFVIPSTLSSNFAISFAISSLSFFFGSPFAVRFAMKSFPPLSASRALAHESVAVLCLRLSAASSLLRLSINDSSSGEECYPSNSPQSRWRRSISLASFFRRSSLNSSWASLSRRRRSESSPPSLDFFCLRNFSRSSRSLRRYPRTSPMRRISRIVSFTSGSD